MAHPISSTEPARPAAVSRAAPPVGHTRRPARRSPTPALLRAVAATASAPRVIGARAVVLAAGSGRRLAPLTDGTPKALLDVHGEPALARLLRQLERAGFAEVVVVIGNEGARVGAAALAAGHPGVRLVENARHAADTNLVSAFLGTEGARGAVIVEGDVVASDAVWEVVAREARDDPDDTIWYTTGTVRDDQAGGMLATDAHGAVTGVWIEREADARWCMRRKLCGIMQVGAGDLAAVRAAWALRDARGGSHYFHRPWLDGVVPLGRCLDVPADAVHSFNTAADYYETLLRTADASSGAPGDVVDFPLGVRLVPVATLRHIEGFSRRRATWLRGKIEREGVWTVPLAVDPQGLVMDGQHRMEVALAMGLDFVPAVVLDYARVRVWSLRDSYTVTAEEIVRRALAGDLYPYKTAKHGFDAPLPRLRVPLARLASFRAG